MSTQDTFDTFSQMDYWLKDHPKHKVAFEKQEKASNAFWTSEEGKKALRNQSLLSQASSPENNDRYW